LSPAADALSTLFIASVKLYTPSGMAVASSGQTSPSPVTTSPERIGSRRPNCASDSPTSVGTM
jgi:hypothetical protein